MRSRSTVPDDAADGGRTSPSARRREQGLHCSGERGISIKLGRRLPRGPRHSTTAVRVYSPPHVRESEAPRKRHGPAKSAWATARCLLDFSSTPPLRAPGSGRTVSQYVVVDENKALQERVQASRSRSAPGSRHARADRVAMAKMKWNSQLGRHYPHSVRRSRSFAVADHYPELVLGRSSNHHVPQRHITPVGDHGTNRRRSHAGPDVER